MKEAWDFTSSRGGIPPSRPGGGRAAKFSSALAGKKPGPSGKKRRNRLYLNGIAVRMQARLEGVSGEGDGAGGVRGFNLNMC